MYHRYRMYQSMMMYGGNGSSGMGMGGYGYGMGHHGYGYNYGHSPYGMNGGRRGFLSSDQFQCMGGCPSNAFCDYGICRCKAGYDARFGSCWNDIESFNQNQAGWNRRQEKGYNPHVSCETHNNCGQIDMNMICFDKNSTCQCRETMAWNDEALECQIYIDVNCTGVTSVETILTGNDNETETELKENDLEESLIYNLTDSSGNVNISELSSEETLENSELAQLNPNTTTEKEIKQAFCRDFAKVQRSY